jgi:hypothetical protein
LIKLCTFPGRRGPSILFLSGRKMLSSVGNTRKNHEILWYPNDGRASTSALQMQQTNTFL